MIYPSPSAKRSASRDILMAERHVSGMSILLASAGRAMPCAPVIPACNRGMKDDRDMLPRNNSASLFNPKDLIHCIP